MQYGYTLRLVGRCRRGGEDRGDYDARFYACGNLLAGAIVGRERAGCNFLGNITQPPRNAITAIYGRGGGAIRRCRLAPRGGREQRRGG